MKLSLKVKLTISYISLSLLLILSLLFTIKYMFNRQFESYIKYNQHKSSAEIASQVIAAYAPDGTPPNFTLLNTIGEAALEKGFVLKVDNMDNELLWCMDPQQCNAMLMHIENNMKDFYNSFNGEYIEDNYSIIKNNVNFGSVTVGYYGPFYYNSSDLKFITMINRIFIFVSLFALAFAIVLGYFIANRIARPIKKVIEHTHQVEQGNYSDRIDFNSNTNEVEQLIHSVNSLTQTLNQQSALRKRLAQDYSHEFRTPLASLKSNLEAMIDGIWQPTRERLESCNEEISRLNRMVSGIDKLVELENSNTVLIKSIFSPLELINKLILNFEKDLYQKDIKLSITGSACQVYADKDKIGQVIINIISNAIKYTDRMGKINIDITNNENAIEISILDNGMGISAEDLPYIFEHLYRADKSRHRDTGGCGIGLAVAKSIVEAHNGRIDVESELGKGSKFIILLPTH